MGDHTNSIENHTNSTGDHTNSMEDHTNSTGNHTNSMDLFDNYLNSTEKEYLKSLDTNLLETSAGYML